MPRAPRPVRIQSFGGRNFNSGTAPRCVEGGSARTPVASVVGVQVERGLQRDEAWEWRKEAAGAVMDWEGDALALASRVAKASAGVRP